MEKFCHKCGDKIPSRIKIDGKWKVISNRKFCIKCSPFGLHNTKRTIMDDNIYKICPHCGISKPLDKFYSKGKHTKYTQSFCCDCFNDLQRRKWIERKISAIKYLGGTCKLCGYSKNYAAMCFHHRDRKVKDFNWQQLRLRNWNEIKKELDKCDLLCCRCHAELHNPECIF